MCDLVAVLRERISALLERQYNTSKDEESEEEDENVSEALKWAHLDHEATSASPLTRPTQCVPRIVLTDRL